MKRALIVVGIIFCIAGTICLIDPHAVVAWLGFEYEIYLMSLFHPDIGRYDNAKQLQQLPGVVSSLGTMTIFAGLFAIAAGLPQMFVSEGWNVKERNTMPPFV